MMDPIKALGRAGMLGNFLNNFDGGVEILDDLDDHWTAKHHKDERNWFIQELQEIAADKSIRVTILGGDVHLCAIGQFFGNKKLRLAKDRDHRYMPNVISSAIVNGPPPVMMADILNRRNKIHHLDEDTDENMIPMFTHDVDGKSRNNKHLLPRRNWCSIRPYAPGTTPPPTPPETPDREDSPAPPSNSSPSAPGKLVRRLSNHLPAPVARRLSRSGPPPAAFENFSRESHGGTGRRSSSISTNKTPAEQDFVRPNVFHRRPTGLSEKGVLKKADKLDRGGHINLEGGLDISLNVEVNQKDPAGITNPYRLLVPALDYHGPPDINTSKRKSAMSATLKSLKDSFTRHNNSEGGAVGGAASGGGGETVIHQEPERKRLTRANTTGGMRGFDESAPLSDRHSRIPPVPAPAHEERGRNENRDSSYGAPSGRRETVSYIGGGRYGYEDGDEDDNSMPDDYEEIHPKKTPRWKIWKR